MTEQRNTSHNCKITIGLTSSSFKGPFKFDFTCDGQPIQITALGKLYELYFGLKPFSQVHSILKNKEDFNWNESNNDAYQVKDFAAMMGPTVFAGDTRGKHKGPTVSNGPPQNEKPEQEVKSPE